jgi:hypothetical protein
VVLVDHSAHVLDATVDVRLGLRDVAHREVLPRRSTRWSATILRRCRGRSRTGRWRCASRSTRARSWSSPRLWTPVPGLCASRARGAASAGWWRSVARFGQAMERARREWERFEV